MSVRNSIMLRSFTISLAVVALIAVLACYGNRDGTTLTSTSGNLGTVNTVSVSTVTTGSGSEVYVEFKGTESFVFPTDTAVPSRLVVIKGNGMNPHKTTVILPVDVVPTTTNVEKDLSDIVGSPVDCKSFGACVFSPRVPIALRIVDSGGNPITQTLTKTARFDSLVPHLQTISEMFGSGKIAELDPELSSTAANPYPKTDTADPFVAYVEISGGVLDARVACGRAAYISTTTMKPNGAFQEFANAVIWTGTTAKAAKLQVNRRNEGTGQPTGWKDITFKNSAFLHIIVLNEPITSGASGHFGLHANVGKDKTIQLPAFDHSQDCEGINKGDIIGCSNTQWP